GMHEVGSEQFRAAIVFETVGVEVVKIDARAVRQGLIHPVEQATRSVAPELAIHAEIGAAGKTAGQTVVIGQAVGMRVPGGERGASVASSVSGRRASTSAPATPSASVTTGTVSAVSTHGNDSG